MLEYPQEEESTQELGNHRHEMIASTLWNPLEDIGSGFPALALQIIRGNGNLGTHGEMLEDRLSH